MVQICALLCAVFATFVVMLHVTEAPPKHATVNDAHLHKRKALEASLLFPRFYVLHQPPCMPVAPAPASPLVEYVVPPNALGTERASRPSDLVLVDGGYSLYGFCEYTRTSDMLPLQTSPKP